MMACAGQVRVHVNLRCMNEQPAVTRGPEPGKNFCLIYIAVLVERYEVGRNTKCLLTLLNSKWPPEVDPGGHHFLLLNVSINKKLIFVSEVMSH